MYLCFDNRQSTFIKKELQLKELYFQKSTDLEIVLQNTIQQRDNLQSSFNLQKNITENKDKEITLLNQNINLKTEQINQLKKKNNRIKNIAIIGGGILLGGFIYQTLK